MGGWTQTPNFIYDLMPSMKEAEMKVVMAVVRQTAGWQTDRVRLRLADFEKLTGMTRPSVNTGIKAALERGVLSRDADGESFIYWLCEPCSDDVVVKNFNHESVSEGKDSEPNSKNSLPSAVKNSNSDTVKNLNSNKRKEYTNKRKKKEIVEPTASTPRARSRSGDVHPNTQPILNAYVEVLGYKPGSYGQEAKAAKQLAKAGYEPIDVVAAYNLLKQQPFWQIKHLSLQTLVKEIPAIQQGLLNGHVPGGTVANGNHNGRASPVDKTQAEADKLRVMLAAQGKEHILHG